MQTPSDLGSVEAPADCVNGGKTWTRVLVIGGGATGVSVARDLALRGVPCILAESHDLNAGASGANHGLLHSGARYVATDPSAAIECRDEGTLLKRLAPQCVHDAGGMFVAVQGDDENFIADFPARCARCGIPALRIEVGEARELEPALSERLIAAYAVEDASIDPFKLSLQSMAQAMSLGSRLLRRTQVVGFDRSAKRIEAVRLRNLQTGAELRVEAEVIVNAAGAWAGEIATLAGAEVPVLFSKGTLVVTHGRLAGRILNRLRPPSDADILVPGGTVSILGTTSMRLPGLADIRPTVPEVDLIVESGSAMVPILRTARYVRAYAGVRPLIGSRTAESDRTVSRGFALLGHEEDGIENLVTITGGKLTTSRLMAERTADLVCRRLRVDRPCLTRTEPLPSAPECEWTEPALAPRRWLQRRNPSDALLCECEMVSRSAIDSIVAGLRRNGDTPRLTDIGLRSRVGKGACQGAFCAVRTAVHLYDRGVLCGDQGLGDLVAFYRERWRGERPVLWGEQLVQSELMEAVHCGLFGEELYAPPREEAPARDRPIAKPQ